MEGKIDRNDPCPCGSDEKYKRGYGAASSSPEDIVGELNPFMINKAIAYKGRIGQHRRDFCVNFIEQKKNQLKELLSLQLEETSLRGETISCKKGCYYCCSASAYVEATLQECEAIVYYLYHNNHVYESFIRKYPQWRDQIKKNDLLDSCARFWEELSPEKTQEITMFMSKKEEKRYRQQSIPCPFLDNKLCSIYEVRPYSCICCVSVSPPEWCNPQSLKEAEIRKVYPIDFLLNMMSDYSFYYKNLERFAITFMPLVVYEILKNGTFYYSYGKIPSLQLLHHEFIHDPDVVTILDRQGLAPNKYITRLNYYSSKH